MFTNFRTRAATRALIGVLLAGVTLGLGFGAACLAGQPSADALRAQALAHAAQAGYAAAHAAASPPPAPSAQVARPTRISATRSRDLDCLAAAVYYEARGESLAGQAAVAQVVLNRAKQPAFPKGVCAVVYQGAGEGECQFSFVCNGAMRGRREPEAWVEAHRIAARALAGYVMAAVGKATCFHAAHGAPVRRADGGLRLGGHVFYATFAPKRPVRTQLSSVRLVDTKPATFVSSAPAATSKAAS